MSAKLPPSQQVVKKINSLIERCSGEWLISKYHMPNGGGVIFVRALISSFSVCVFVYGITCLIDYFGDSTFYPEKSRPKEILKVFGVIFAATYATYYTRFASQWSYIANLYNQIKQTECAAKASINTDVLYQWKAGFIEDADVLHLSNKPPFATVIQSWAAVPEIRKKFIENTAGGEVRLQGIIERAELTVQLTKEKYPSA